MKLGPPVTYQGAKQRIAKQIVDIIEPYLSDITFCDLCCGSGAISIELVQRNYPISNIIMCDAGPWGLFWAAIGSGGFSLNQFIYYLRQLPTDKSKIKAYLEDLAKQPVDGDAPYVFLLLQVERRAAFPVKGK